MANGPASALKTFSAVFPAFEKNEEKYIKNCLKSIQRQTYNPIEIIVVDNNSTDKTEAWTAATGHP